MSCLSSLRAAVIAIVERQHGVISRAQLLALGVPRTTIQEWRLRGLLHTLHPGVYAWGHRLVSWQGRCFAALLAAGEGTAIAHAAAAVLHGLMTPRPTLDVISPRRRRGDGTLRIHRGSLAAHEITEREGIRVTTVERTLFDLCDGRLVSEAIARGLTSLSALNDFVNRKRGAAGAARFAKVLGLPQYRSKFERHFHRWLQARGFPEPAVNEKVGRRTYDFVWREQGLIVETDGPHHRTPQQLADDKRAAAEAARHGYRVLRVPEEGFASRQEHVARQIRTELMDDWNGQAVLR
jgi:very-short-patch-repair endonuclease